jgi:hypothetical protein
VLGCLLLAATAHAQTPTASWVQSDGGDTTYVYTLKNGTTVVPIGTVTCTAAHACSAPITGTVTSGTYTLTATNAAGLSATGAPLVLGAPAAPTGLTITVTTTTTVTTAKPQP